MERIVGQKIHSGVAIGKIIYWDKEEAAVGHRIVSDIEGELLRYEEAKEKTKEQFCRLYHKAASEVGEANAQIFQVYAMLLDDPSFDDSVKTLIKTQSVNAEYAVASTGDDFTSIFENMEDEYFKARAADMKDIVSCMITTLNAAEEMQLTEPGIIVADDLSPSETIRIDKSKVLAFVTKNGSVNSHTAILSRTMDIPALTDVDIDARWHGKLAAADGTEGVLVVEPDDKTLKAYEKIAALEQEKKKLLLELKGKETITSRGKKLNLYANISSVTDLESALQNDAEGIGLFRSEFLYLKNSRFPTEEEQFVIYKQVAEAMQGKQVIIRTLDIGADKQVDYFGLEKEENPALGYRAIRICLTQPELFKTQLRAIYRAGAYGNISVMYPMITSWEEIRDIKAVVEEVKGELASEGIPYGEVKQGVMIETPAAALISDIIAKEVDFFSIGTNDLTQYTLAVDRQNQKLGRFYQPHHEAVMRLIKMVVDNAHQAGIWAGICGELGADTQLTARFLEMGVDELSVSPGAVLPIRKIIREM